MTSMRPTPDAYSVPRADRRSEFAQDARNRAANDGPLGGRGQTVEKILNSIRGAGIEFIDENGGGPGVRLKKTKRQTQKK